MSYPSTSLPAHEARRLWASAGAEVDRFRDLEARRVEGEPLQYLEGTAVFGPIEVLIDHRVLVPRPETEQLWELAMKLIPAPGVIVDLCTGSGALALACRARHPDARVLATELSPAAAELARFNAGRLGLDVEVLEGDLFDPLPANLRGHVDLVLANPPYVAEADWETLPMEVRREPKMALVAGSQGTEVIDRITAGIGEWLAPWGWVAIEIGETQGEHACRVLATQLSDTEVRRDLTGRDRFVIGRR